VHVGFDVIRDVRREEDRENQPRDEQAADDRQIEYGTRSATGKRSNMAAAEIVATPPSSSAATVAPVNVSRKVRSAMPAGSSIRVSAQTCRPIGGAAPSAINEPTRRGTQVMATPGALAPDPARDSPGGLTPAGRAPTRANANAQSRRAPAICSGT